MAGRPSPGAAGLFVGKGDELGQPRYRERGGRFDQVCDASLAFHFKNAVIINGRVYIENYKHAISNERQLPSPALNLSLKPICISRAPYSHQSYYERYFNQDWTPQYRSRIDNLIIFQDYSQGSSKRQRYEALRSKLSEQLTPNGSNNGLVYLRRGDAGSSRRVLNESELEKELSKRGFVIADSNDANPEAMLKSMMGAKLIVSMEGSHPLPFLFTMATNGGLIMLQPSDRFECTIRGIAGCLGIKFGFLVGSKEGDGYRFSIPDLLKVIDRILA